MVCYPHGVRFDREYYVKTHLPLARDAYGSHLAGVEMVSIGPSPGGGDPPYQVITTLRFADEAAMKAAFAAPEARSVNADVKNFFDGRPVILFGTVDAS